MFCVFQVLKFKVNETKVETCIFSVPRLYLMKQVSRRYSVDLLQQASQIQALRWLIPPHLKQNDQVFSYL